MRTDRSGIPCAGWEVVHDAENNNSFYLSAVVVLLLFLDRELVMLKVNGARKLLERKEEESTTPGPHAKCMDEGCWVLCALRKTLLITFNN